MVEIGYLNTLGKYLYWTLAAQIELIEKLQMQIAITLGKSISDSIKMKFYFQLAKDSLRF